MVTVTVGVPYPERRRARPYTPTKQGKRDGKDGLAVVLSYTTPKRKRRHQVIEFDLDEERFKARRPKDSMLVLLAASDASGATSADRILAVWKFINACFTPAGQARIDAKLRDFDDPMEFTDLVAITEDLAEKFGLDDQGSMPAFQDGAPTAVPGRPFRARDHDDDTEADVQDITPAQPNRATRRATPTKAKAVKAVPVKAAKGGRALPT